MPLLASLLLIRWKRALKTKEVAEEAIQELMPGRNCHGKNHSIIVVRVFESTLEICCP